MRRWSVAAAVAALSLVACGAGSATTASNSRPDAARAAGPAAVPGGSGAPQGAPGVAPAPAQAGTPAGTEPSSLEAPAAQGPRVIRTGRVTLQVANGALNDKLDELQALVVAGKGYIADGNTQPGAEPGPVHVITVVYQIPEASFDDALTRIRKLGTLESMNLTGQDVSTQYVDLTARLKVQQEQRDFYLSLLGQAKSTQEIITIRNQLASVLDQIERLQGQINYYEHATTYATLSVTFREAAALVRPAQQDAWGFSSALMSSARLFVGTINWIVIVLGAAGPFLLLGIPVIVLLWRRRPGRLQPAAEA